MCASTVIQVYPWESLEHAHKSHESPLLPNNRPVLQIHMYQIASFSKSFIKTKTA